MNQSRWNWMIKISIQAYHQNFLMLQQIESACRTCRRLVWRQRHPSWSNRASPHLEQLTTLRAQKARRSFEEPVANNVTTTDWSEYKNQLTTTSASKKTHLSNWVRFQQCSLVNVIPSSGRFNTAKFAASLESRTSTTWTRSKTSFNLLFIDSDTDGVIMTASWCWVETFLSEWATTNAPKEYESLVANVTHANSGKE